MKKLLCLAALVAALNCTQGQEYPPVVLTNTDTLNLRDLCHIVDPLPGDLNVLFTGLIKAKYCLELQNGATSAQANIRTLEYLADKVDEWTGLKPNKP